MLGVCTVSQIQCKLETTTTKKNAVNIHFDLSDNYFFLFEKKKNKQSWMVKCSHYGESTEL